MRTILSETSSMNINRQLMADIGKPAVPAAPSSCRAAARCELVRQKLRVVKHLVMQH
jgi:hypothetical protein